MPHAQLSADFNNLYYHYYFLNHFYEFLFCLMPGSVVQIGSWGLGNPPLPARL